MGYAEVLQDTSEIHRLLLSLRNSFAPVNRIPPEVLSLIPDYCDKDDLDQDLIKLTHVCRGWRDTFTSRSSLWTKLYFTNIDKTRTYIRRSQSSPMQIYLIDDQNTGYLDDAVSLVIPHPSTQIPDCPHGSPPRHLQPFLLPDAASREARYLSALLPHPNH
ncbi:hypothetical protein BJ322DRAFT_244248 [Thelephora terrestris]|uniref:F-box domain-containing protein n=1 Tax=Thelephora terrestris TaxID=56493 RepID=A0A9P6H9B5_9AGAM|nr:hypothetical protein BJ322DRAFT_244248 [Thelephora terrestris]